MLFILFLSCNTGKVIIGTGEDGFDARFVSQVYTWGCGEFTEDPYLGTFGHEVVLYHAPASLTDLLPEEGCELNKDMFPESAGSGSADIDGLQGFPEWDSTFDSGQLQGGFGYWFEDVMTGEHTCDSPYELLEHGTILENASHFTGATTPSAGQIPTVEFIGIDGSLINWGDNVEVTWDNVEWERVWVNIRRVREGDVWETVTCNVSGESSFELGEEVWGLMDENLNVEYNNLYVTFEKRELLQVQSGHWIEVLSRVVSLAVIPD